MAQAWADSGIGAIGPDEAGTTFVDPRGADATHISKSKGLSTCIQ